MIGNGDQRQTGANVIGATIFADGSLGEQTPAEISGGSSEERAELDNFRWERIVMVSVNFNKQHN